MITLVSIPQPSPDVIGRVLDNEAVLVHPQRGKVKVLNEVGAFIWAALDGARTVRTLAEMVCHQFEVDNQAAEIDTLEFLNALQARELILITEPQS